MTDDILIVAAQGSVDFGEFGGNVGPPGPPGEAGTQGIIWQGAWAVGTSYFIDDAVENDGSSYIAIANNTGSEPPSGNWELLADAGATGASGDAGDAGSAGAAGTDGATWSTGTGVPTGGVNGDLYLDTGTDDVYKKVAGDWGVIGTLRGVDGADGSAGSSGIIGTWRGEWDDGYSYLAEDRDIAEYDGSSYLAITDNLNDPPPSVNWNLVAGGGLPGPAGLDGSNADDLDSLRGGSVGQRLVKLSGTDYDFDWLTAGSTVWRGPWSNGEAYVAKDVARYGDRLYICSAAVGPVGTTPPADAGHWDFVIAGVPLGGLISQVLAKSSGTDYALEWVEQSGGGGGGSNLDGGASNTNYTGTTGIDGGTS